MQNPDSEIPADLSPYFEALVDVPKRDLQKAIDGRSRYIDQLNALLPETNIAVSPGVFTRLNNQIKYFIKYIQKKEIYKMGAIASIITIVMLAVGGTGVYAAQNSLPGDLLYPVKTAVEEIRYTTEQDAQSRFTSLDEMLQNRFQEMDLMEQNGRQLNEEFVERVQSQTDLMLQTTAALDDNAISPALEEIQLKLKTQLDNMQVETDPGGDEDGDADQDQDQDRTKDQLRDQIRDMLRLRLDTVDEAMLDVNRFRNQMQKGMPSIEVTTDPEVTTSADTTDEETEVPDDTLPPANGNHYGIETPGAGNNYDYDYDYNYRTPSPDCPLCTPAPQSTQLPSMQGSNNQNQNNNTGNGGNGSNKKGNGGDNSGGGGKGSDDSGGSGSGKGNNGGGGKKQR